MFHANRLLISFCLGIAVAGLLVLAATVAHAAHEVTISQRGRKFDPQVVELARGDTLVIVNDDGGLLHHAYIESDSFNFDSGDQKPGSQARVSFPISGDFKVLCGIHPKMKLAVHVR